MPVSLVAATLLAAFGQALVGRAWAGVLTAFHRPLLGASAAANAYPVGTVVYGVVIGPTLEELVFRAGLTRLLLKRLGAPAAVVLSAIAFAAAHVSLVQSVPAFVLGVLLGYVYTRTRSVRLCIVGHMAANGLPALCLLATGLATGAADVTARGAVLAQIAQPAWVVARVAALVLAWTILLRYPARPADEPVVAADRPLDASIARALDARA